MTVGDWLASRTPEAPPALRARVESALRASAGAARDRSEATAACLDAAELLVGELLRAEVTSRHAALDLLAADALVTYAFEAATDAPQHLVGDASRAMTRLAALAPASS